MKFLAKHLETANSRYKRSPFTVSRSQVVRLSQRLASYGAKLCTKYAIDTRQRGQVTFRLSITKNKSIKLRNFNRLQYSTIFQVAIPHICNSLSLWNTVSNTAHCFILPREKPCHEDLKGTQPPCRLPPDLLCKGEFYTKYSTFSETAELELLGKLTLCPWLSHFDIHLSRNSKYFHKNIPLLNLYL